LIGRWAVSIIAATAAATAHMAGTGCESCLLTCSHVCRVVVPHQHHPQRAPLSTDTVAVGCALSQGGLVHHLQQQQQCGHTSRSQVISAIQATADECNTGNSK
jgi:hypothetical protein